MDNLETLFTKHSKRRLLIRLIRTVSTFGIGLSIFLLNKNEMGAIFISALPAAMFSMVFMMFSAFFVSSRYTEEEATLLVDLDMTLVKKEMKSNAAIGFLTLSLLIYLFGFTIDVIFPSVLFSVFTSISLPFTFTNSRSAGLAKFDDNGSFLIGNTGGQLDFINRVGGFNDTLSPSHPLSTTNPSHPLYRNDNW